MMTIIRNLRCMVAPSVDCDFVSYAMRPHRPRLRYTFIITVDAAAVMKLLPFAIVSDIIFVMLNN